MSPEQIAHAARYREMIAKTGRFLTFCGGAPTIGYRMRENPAERAALRIVRETDAGLVLNGKIGMHTSPAYAEDLYVGSISRARNRRPARDLYRAGRAPGITVLCRKIAVRDENPFVAPLSSRFDELDGQMWLDDVFVPWESVFFLGQSPEPVVRWLIWHHVYGWLSKAEFTLGLALALAHAMGLAGTNRRSSTARPDDRGADRAQLPRRLRARAAFYRERLLRAQPCPSRRRRVGDPARPPAHGRDPAHRARLLAGRRAVRQRPRRPRDGGGL